MSKLSREVLDYWEAYYSIEPFGEQSKQQAESTLWNYRTWAAQLETKAPRLDYDAFMPDGYRPPPKKIEIQTMTPEQEQSAFCAVFGIKAN